MSDGDHDHAPISPEMNSGLAPSQPAMRWSSAALNSAALPGAPQPPVIGIPPTFAVRVSPSQVCMIPLVGVLAAYPSAISSDSRTQVLFCRPLYAYTTSSPVRLMNDPDIFRYCVSSSGFHDAG